MFSKTWVGDRLRADGFITATQLSAAIQAMDQHAERIEESLIRVGAITEKRLLRYLAEKTQTQYVSSAKLAQLEVPRETLHKVPQKLAEKLKFVPVRYDQEANELMVASADAGVPEYVKQLTLATKFRNLKAYIARPAAVQAAIRKWYRGEAQAFASIAPEAFSQMHGGPQLSNAGTERAVTQPSRAGRTGMQAEALVSSRAPTGQVSAGPDRRELDLAEMLQVLVGLNESVRGEFRGHSNQVARMVRELTALIGLDEVGTLHLALAANLHDVGKPAEPHLTLLSVNQYQPHRISAQQLVRTPLSWLANVDLPSDSTDAVASMYERFDGRGFPIGLRGGEIPLGARVLSACDAFSDLTANPRNPYRRTLSEAEAYEVIAQFEGSLFDPYVVEHLAQLLGFTPDDSFGGSDAMGG
jgi:HD-GYP domain-containing protein (c-di-GMP phosphodiesterase class II)